MRDAAFRMLTDGGVLALLVYLAWLDGGARRLLGLQRPAPADALWGAGALVVCIVASAAVYPLVTVLGAVEEPAQPPPPEPGVAWIYPAYVLVGALLEEALFRAFLWNRFRELTGRPWLSLAAASALFSAVHVYPLAASVDCFVFGLVLGAAFVVRRSLWRLVLAHWAWNLFVAS